MSLPVVQSRGHVVDQALNAETDDFSSVAFRPDLIPVITQVSVQCLKGRFDGAWTISPKNTEDVNSDEPKVVDFVSDDAITARMGIAERTGSVKVTDLQESVVG